MDPSKLFRNGGVLVHRGSGAASDSEASQHSVKLRPKADSSALKPRVKPAPSPSFTLRAPEHELLQHRPSQSFKP